MAKARKCQNPWVMYFHHEKQLKDVKPLTPYLGTDGLRLWVASSNYKQDVSFSPEVLTRVSEVAKSTGLLLSTCWVIYMTSRTLLIMTK